MEILITDIETTGFNEYSDAIVEIGIVLVDTETKKTELVFDKVVKHKNFKFEKHKDAWVFQNTSLNAIDVENAKLLTEYQPEIQDLFNKYPMTAYNKSFDIRFMAHAGFKMVDTKCLLKSSHQYSLLKDKRGNKKKPSVQEIYNQFFIKEGEKRYVEKHRAGADAMDEARILLRLVELKDSGALVVENTAKDKEKKEYKPLGLNDELRFGKYKEMTIADVIKKNVGYLHWCLENIKTFKITDEVKEAIEAKKAVVVN